MAKDQSGKRYIFNVSFVLHLMSSAFLFIAYVSPYWFQSWARVYSPFKRIGMWEACFAGLVLPMDREQKAYHGCWWILAEEFIAIREWVMPWWFIITQIVTTIVFLALIVNTIIFIYTWGVTSKTNKSGTGKRRIPIVLASVSLIITILSAILISSVVILFGVAVFYDRNWMPYPKLNFLSWSYGFAVLSAFFLIFTSIAQTTYTTLERQELREPPATMPAHVLGYPRQSKDTMI